MEGLSQQVQSAVHGTTGLKKQRAPIFFAFSV